MTLGEIDKVLGEFEDVLEDLQARINWLRHRIDAAIPIHDGQAHVTGKPE